MPDYIVIRAAPSLPPGLLPPEWEGRWLARENLPAAVLWPADPGVGVTAVSTDRFETREDGANARVFEVQVAGADLDITSLYVDGVPSGLRVDHADPVVQFHASFMRDIAACPGPYVSLTDGVLTIRAVNGTWCYRLRDGWEDEDGPQSVLGDRIDVVQDA